MYLFFYTQEVNETSYNFPRKYKTNSVPGRELFPELVRSSTEKKFNSVEKAMGLQCNA